MRLFIAEKPNVGTSIAAQLGVKERKDGYLVTKTGDLVTWCFGHLMELAEPDAYLDKNVPEACALPDTADLSVWSAATPEAVRQAC